MEILIGLAVLCLGGWWLFLRNNEQSVTPAPYKVETPSTPEPAPVVVEAAPAPVVVEAAPATVTVIEQITDSVTQAAPEKKTRKPRAPKVEKPVVKVAAKKAAAPKKAAAMKTTKAKAKSKKA